MNSNQELKEIVFEYRKSRIQSEAEVRTKFVIPLLGYLGYPQEMRSEEFPVYGFEGGKRIPAKNADFILFSDSRFGEYRTFTQKNVEWVHNHSLLVVETKKPDELPEVNGQSMYYTMWTKAVAYMVTDGEIIKGYIYNPASADIELVNCRIDEILENTVIDMFSYENILLIKQQMNCQEGNIVQIIKKNYFREEDKRVLTDEEITLPDHALQYMRNALGRNAGAKGKAEVLSAFLGVADMCLQHDLRYDIPEFMFDIPREIENAFLYIDNMLFPLTRGTVTHYYWNEYDRYCFENDCIEIYIIYKKEKIYDVSIGYHVLDKYVEQRISNFCWVKKCMNANSIRIAIENSDTNILFTLRPGKKSPSWKSDICMLEFWISNLEKMRVIEEFYEIKFELAYINGTERLNDLYDAVSFVYDGIVMKANCELTIHGGFADENIEITKPILVEKDVVIPLPVRHIHNFSFIPYASVIMPGVISVEGTTSEDILRVEGCCLYKVDDKMDESDS